MDLPKIESFYEYKGVIEFIILIFYKKGIKKTYIVVSRSHFIVWENLYLGGKVSLGISTLCR